MNRLIDLSHTVEDGMITYKGLPGPVICDYLTRQASQSHYAPGVEFHMGKIEMVANTGTYVDAPFHRYADGKDLSELPLERLADVEIVIVRAPIERGRAIDASAFAGRDIAGRAVLVDTGWSRHWRSDRYFAGHPFVTAEGARFLREAGAAIVGIDSLNIDDTADLTRPTHSELLRHDIPIIEHLTHLHAVPETGGRLFAVPVKVKAFGTFPVRAFCVC